MKKLLLLIASLIGFSLFGVSTAVPDAHAGEVTLMAVGDILPHPSWQPFQIPVSNLYKGVATTFFEANVVIGNLESPLTDKAEPTASKSPESIEEKKNFVFKAEDESTAQGLKEVGFTVLTLANNHMLDYREEGMLDTIDKLYRADVKTAGAGSDAKEALKPCVVEADGVEFVVISASDVVPKGFEATLTKAGIASMKNDNAFIKRVADERRFYPDAVLVLALHWGTEAAYLPTARQKLLAHRLIDAGADLIIGHHPHRIQGVEIYNDRPIFYSLGNFQFDTKPPGDEGMIAKLVYKDGSKSPESVSVIPVEIKPGGYPTIPEDGTKEYNDIMARMDKLCAPFGQTLNGGAIVALPPADKNGTDYWGI